MVTLTLTNLNKKPCKNRDSEILKNKSIELINLLLKDTVHRCIN